MREKYHKMVLAFLCLLLSSFMPSQAQLCSDLSILGPSTTVIYNCDNTITFQVKNTSTTHNYTNVYVRINLPTCPGSYCTITNFKMDNLTGLTQTSGCVANTLLPGTSCPLAGATDFIIPSVPANCTLSFSYTARVSCDVFNQNNSLPPSYCFEYTLYPADPCSAPCSATSNFNQCLQAQLSNVLPGFPAPFNIGSSTVTAVGTHRVVMQITNNTPNDLNKTVDVFVCSPSADVTLTSPVSFGSAYADPVLTPCGTAAPVVVSTDIPCAGGTLYKVTLNYANLTSCGLSSTAFTANTPLFVAFDFNVNCFVNPQMLRFYTAWKCDPSDADYCHLYPLQLQLIPDFPDPHIEPLAVSVTPLGVDNVSHYDTCYGMSNTTPVYLKLENSGLSPAVTTILLHKPVIAGTNLYTNIIPNSFILQNSAVIPATWTPNVVPASATNPSDPGFICDGNAYFDDLTINVIIPPNTTQYLFWHTRTCCVDTSNHGSQREDYWEYRVSYGLCNGTIVNLPSATTYNNTPSVILGSWTADYNGVNDMDGYGVGPLYPNNACNPAYAIPDPFGEIHNVCFDFGPSPIVWRIGNNGELVVRLSVDNRAFNFEPINGAGMGTVSIFFQNTDIGPVTLNPAITDLGINTTTCLQELEFSFPGGGPYNLLKLVGSDLVYWNNAKVCFNIRPHCTGGGPATAPISVNLVLRPTASPGCNCEIPLGTATGSIAIHCPGCLRQGVHPKAFNFTRNTYGYADDNDDGRWEDFGGPTQLDPSNIAAHAGTIRTSRAMVGDIIQGNLRADIQIDNGYAPWPIPQNPVDCPSSVFTQDAAHSFPNGYWEFEMLSTACFQTISAMDADLRLQFSYLGNTYDFTLHIPQSQIHLSTTTANAYIYDFSIANFAALPGWPSTLTAFINGMDITGTNRFRIVKNVGTIDMLCTSRNTIYLAMHPQEPFVPAGTQPALFDPDDAVPPCPLFCHGCVGAMDDYICQTDETEPCSPWNWKWFCETYGGVFHVRGYALGLWTGLPGGAVTLTSPYWSYGANAFANIEMLGNSHCYSNSFPGEFRNWLKPNFVNVTRPPQWQYAGGTWHDIYARIHNNPDPPCYPYNIYYDYAVNVGADHSLWDYANYPLTQFSDGSITLTPHFSYANTDRLSVYDDDYWIGWKSQFYPDCDAPEVAQFDFETDYNFSTMSNAYGLNYQTVPALIPSHYNFSKTINYSLTDRPVLDVNAAVAVGCSGTLNEAVWTVTIQNVGLMPAGLAFFAIDPQPGNNVNITSVEQLITSPPPIIINPIDGNLYTIKNPSTVPVANTAYQFDPGEVITLIFRGTYDCTANPFDAIHLQIGWSSILPELTLAQFQANHPGACLHPIDLQVDPNTIQMTNIISAPAASLCSTFDVSSHLFNSGCYVLSPDGLSITMPSTGFILNSTSANINYLGANHSVTLIGSNPYVVSAADLLSIFPADLPGILSSSYNSASGGNNNFTITFSVTSNCEVSYNPADFIVLNFIAGGGCPDPINYHLPFNPLFYSSDPQLNYLVIDPPVTTPAVNNCSGVTHLTFNADFAPGTVAITGASNVFTIQVPAGFTVVAGSITPAYGTVATTSSSQACFNTTGNYVQWNIPANLNAIPAFSFNVTLDPATSCGFHDFDACMATVGTFACPSTGTNCVIDEVQDNQTFSINATAPVSSFSVADTTPCATQSVNFTSLATCGNFLWNFDDGTTSSVDNPAHVFATAGPHNVCLDVTAVANGGCSSQHCLIVDVQACNITCGVDANFVFSPSTQNGHVIDFIATPILQPGTNISYNCWNFGDGTSLTCGSTTLPLTNTSHYYYLPGTYTVCVYTHAINPVGGNDLCVDSICYEVTVLPDECNQVPAFSFVQGTEDCHQVQYTYEATVTAPAFITSWEWMFDDGTTSTDVNPLHTFTDFGNHHVCLVVYGGNGALDCVDSICHDFVLISCDTCLLDASFNYVVDPLTCEAQFYGDANVNGSTNVVSWVWIFGDDNSFSTLQDPTHQFTQNGVWPVNVFVTAVNGTDTCYAQLCDTVNITCGDSCYIDIAWSYSLNPDSCSVQFFDETVFPGNANILQYTWTFENGVYSHDQNPVHIFTGSGDHCVNLFVMATNASGTDTCYASTCDTVHVFCCSAVPGFEHSLNTDSCLVSFVNTTTLGDSTCSVHYLWNFDDGTTSTDVNPVHHFNANGWYNVCLTSYEVCGNDSCVRQHCDSVYVGCNCEVHANWYYAVGIEHCRIIFTNGSVTDTSCTATYDWNFGDGSANSSNENPVHYYNGNGFYDVCLIVTQYCHNDTCADTLCNRIQVNNCDTCSLTPAWSSHPNHIDCSMTFVNNSEVDTLCTDQWDWDFGDGSSHASTYNTSHTYAHNGTYIVCLTQTEICRDVTCAATYCDTIVVNNCDTCHLAADFIYEINNEKPCDVYFADNTVYPSGYLPYEYVWNFGDGSPLGSGVTETHHYNGSGPWWICVTIYITNGVDSCFGSHCESVSLPGCENVPCNLDADFTYNYALDKPCELSFHGHATYVSPWEIAYYNWDITGVGQFTGQNISYTFPSTGYYPVCLTVAVYNKDNPSDTCYFTYCDTVFVPECGDRSCFIDVKMDIKPLDERKCNFRFTDFSVPDANTNIVGWSWSIDGNFASSANFFTVSLPGTGYHEICLTVFGVNINSPDIVCSYTLCDSVYTEGCDSCKSVANFDFRRENCNAMFTNTSIIPGGYNLLTYIWEFGDGTTSTSVNPSHMYNHAGSYIVCLTAIMVSGGEGKDTCISRNCREVKIEPCEGGPCALDPKFDYKINGCKVQFTDISSSGTGTTIFGWSWDFGDGFTSNAQNPLHTYCKNGRYTVCLTIFGTNGRDTCRKVYCTSFAITGCEAGECKVQADFTALIHGCTVNFFDLSTTAPSTTITSWTWSFDDGSPYSNLENPTHVFTKPGTYKICLKVSGYNCEKECVSEICKFITVSCERPVGSAAVLYRLIPNPTKGNFKLVVDADEETDATVMIFDTYGNRLRSSDINIKQGINSYEYDMQTVSEGVYLVRIVENGKQSVLKLVVLKN